jgi:DNA topoisomerase-2
MNKSDIEKYDKMTQREHILARPDTYIGDIEPTNELMWIYENGTIIQKQITYTPGFYKIFDEILINARDASVNDPTCNKIEIEYNKEEKYIKVGTKTGSKCPECGGDLVYQSGCKQCSQCSYSACG